MDKLVVKELIQDKLTVENLKNELSALVTGDVTREQLQKDYASLKQLLSEGGNASSKAAAFIIGFLRSAT